MPINPTKKGQASKSASQPANATPAKISRKRKMDADAQKYYAVRAGVNPGVYLTWAECQEQTAGFRGASCSPSLAKRTQRHMLPVRRRLLLPQAKRDFMRWLSVESLEFIPIGTRRRLRSRDGRARNTRDLILVRVQ
ncbi:hypothetical protein F4813DRAFT_76193 [Daldinia decipiens]|uniref:uncharacterized protein n=1 Tax=Daldinia decipiens TaxID=326647 RepID=UPI0020C1FB15|nr:uncharacterized protein F4813DRAFT_76193 [Daldinia decipiens]KAI1657431.1 hypothetical protein F4813DRAFT_76193 [Daldinia decipiens]